MDDKIEFPEVPESFDRARFERIGTEMLANASAIPFWMFYTSESLKRAIEKYLADQENDDR